ncbi:hypothetical protein [Mixta mediterraneensis]|uniref:hypothetical protein n=1 Tax=Mixta mediterraneensis TaxID=2758443 RepID=UPI001875E1FE|nr:hypothetical protein [Mixta mediterraneensis]MBE5252518.1 hypothetical protein [Mixta mediterraneensis]
MSICALLTVLEPLAGLGLSSITGLAQVEAEEFVSSPIGYVRIPTPCVTIS